MTQPRGTVLAVCTSAKKGVRKVNQGQADLKADWGIVGDAHAANWHRQVSLLAWESIQKMRDLGLNVQAGSFAENVTTQGIELAALPVGTRLRLGEAEVQVTQIGKVCHDRCAIYQQAGDCVMPREGIFVRVLSGGPVQVGDAVAVLEDPHSVLNAAGRAERVEMASLNCVFDTERLVIRTATEQDVDLLYRLWTDPRVMADVGFPHGLRITRQEIEQSLQKPFDSEFERVLVVELKATGQAIGQCGMHAADEEGIAGTDIKLLPAFWGHKYGVEVKRGLVSHLFAHTRCTAVQATPNVDNVASIRMQEAVGGVRVGEQVYEFPESMRDYTTPVHHYIYRVYRKDWEQGQPED